MTETESLRLEKISFLVGTIMGQISELLNSLKSEDIKIGHVYSSLRDIHRMVALQINEIYYKGNKP